MLGVQKAISGNRGGTVEPDHVTVYVAGEVILAGMLLDEKSIKTEKRLKESVPEGAVLDPKDFLEHAVVVKMFPGDVITEHKLGGKGRMGASISIPDGMRPSRASRWT